MLFAGLAGLLFSPIAARLRGIYLGVASLGLVFIGIHVLNVWETVTGGFNGRIAPDFSLFGFSFGNDDPHLFVAGVEFREAERLWYLGLFLAVARLRLRQEPAAQPPRPRPADAARQRGRRLGHGRQRPALQGPRLPRQLDVRRARRRPLRAVDRQHRPGVVRAACSRSRSSP